MKHINVLLLLFLSLLISNVTNSSNDFLFRHYTNKQGLSHNTVYCMQQDNQGYLWFGTDDGLNRFDGQKFIKYQSSPSDSTSIPSDRIFSLFEDSKKRLWVCSFGPTCYYDNSTNNFHKINLPEDFGSSNFHIVKEDKYGIIWFIHNNSIVSYNDSKNEYKKYKISEEYHSSACLSDQKELVISDTHSIYTYSSEKQIFSEIEILKTPEQRSQNMITHIYNIPNSGFLIGTSKAGLLYYNSNNKNTRTIIKDIYVRNITNRTPYEYWIASESGIFIYNIIDNSIRNISKSPTNPYSLSDNAVYCLSRDKEDGIWIGTFFGGVNYLPKKYVSFKHFISGKTNMDMGGNAIREICQDKYENLWIGTEDDGFNCYNPSTHTFINFSNKSTQRYIEERNIHGLLADDNQLWIGTFFKGFYLLDIPSMKVIKKFTSKTTNNQLPSNFVLCFHKMNKDSILIGTDNGLSVYNKKDQKVYSWADSIKTTIRQIYKDTQGTLWFATSQGVYNFQTNKNNLTHYFIKTDDPQVERKQDITSIFEDSRKNIWICTKYGVYLLDKNKQEICDKPAIHIPSRIIYRIEEDNNQNLWISSSNGLYCYNPTTQKNRLYTNKDGLHESQFNYSSSFKDKDGGLYFGTINGLTYFQPNDFHEDKYVPPIYITNVYSQNKKNTIPIKDNTITLPYNQSSFTLSFVALSYTSPNAIKYAYKLENGNEDWQYVDSKQDITFAKLAPGKYTFIVKSTNSTGQWQENEKSLHIIVTPPFYATIYAFLIYILLLAGGFYAIYKYKKRRIIKEQIKERSLYELEKEKELYEAKLHFFTVITHEIRTPLTLIKAPLEKIIKSNDGTSDTKKYLNIIHSNTERLHNLTNQLMDYHKIKSNEFNFNFLTTDVTVWLDSIVQSFLPAFEREHKTFTKTYSQTNITAEIDREAFAKIIHNMLSNALKYSDKNTHLTVEEPDNINNCFIIKVTNDGLLIQKEDADKIFNPFYRLKENENKEGSGIGLSLALSLSRNHGGNLQYLQTEDKRNQFVLTLPIHQSSSVALPESQGKKAEAATTESGILIVEDQQEMLDFIASELKVHYNIFKAGNGKEAIEIVKEKNIELIISDIMMPEMDGFELCNFIKNDVNYSHIPIILLTAQLNSRYQLKGLNTGADAYMQKPFSVEILQAQVDSLLKNRKLIAKSYQEKPLTPVETLAVNPMDNVFLKTLNKYIEEHLTQDKLNIEQVAQEMNMSTSSLYRKVKNLSGVSPNDFIRITRLKKAVSLMHQGENRISDIAYATGFTTPAYFSTCFQKQYGKSPSEYIKELRGIQE